MTTDFKHSIDQAKAEAHGRLIEQMRRILGDEICAVFDDPKAVEIMLNDDGKILVERHGSGITEIATPHGALTLSPSKAVNFLSLMAAYRDTTVGKEKPIVEGAMPDEFRRSRFAGCIPPLTPMPTFSIRLPTTQIFTLDDYVASGIMTADQKTALEQAIEGRKNIVVSGGTGCHAKGTEILMADGSIKKVEEIRVGDTVMGPDSTPREVLRLHRGIEPMYRIIPNKGEPFEVNEGHYLALESTPRQRGAPRRKVEITVRDYLRQNDKFKHLYKLYRVPVDFPPLAEPLPIDPYFLGVLLGDGGLMGSISVSKPDIEIRDEVFAQAANYGLHVNTYYRSPNNPSYRLCGQDKGPHHHNRLIRQLAALHLHRQPCADKFIPQPYKVSGRVERLQLLAGLLDTDGHYAGNHFDLILKAETLARDIAFVARTLGFHASVTPCEKSCQTGAVGTYYRVYIGGDLSCVPTRIFRKQATAKHRRTKVLATGFQVDPVGVGAYYGIEVTKDHLYLLSDCTVTRNSGKTTALNALSHHVAQISGLDQRVVIIEDTREIVCQAPNTVQFLTDPDAGIDMQRLLKLTLRYRPDRIFVGEVRDGAALALLDAWNTGHPGGLATIHANNPEAALVRLDTLCQRTGVPSQAALIQEAVGVIVQIERDKNAPAGRRISAIHFLEK